MDVMGSGEASSVKEASGSLDISERGDVNTLRKSAIGLSGVLFISFAAMSPLTGQLGNVPLAIGLGNGIGAPAGFEIGIVMLVLFSVGYVKMMRSVPSSGGFYSFISHGLGRPLGMAAGWSSILAYAFVVGSLFGAFGYFGNITISQFFHVGVPWPYLAFGALIVIVLLGHFDVRIGTAVLGVALILEIVVLTVMDVAVFAHGGGPGGVSAAPINPVNAFKGLAPGVGIFFAVWSWVGFETIPNYAEESRNPRRIGAQALFISVIGGGIFFAICAWAVVSGWGLHAVDHEAATNGGNLYYGVTTKFAAKWVTDVMEWLILTSSFACALSFHNTHSRYLYVIGREQIFHPRLGRTHPRWKSPHIASVTQSVVAAIIIGLFAIFTGSNDPNSQAYIQLYGLMAVMGVIIILSVQAVVSLAVLVYFERFHKDEAHWWRTRLAPLLAFVSQAYVVYLLFTNIDFLGAGSYSYANWLGPIDAVVVLAGVGTAFYFKKYKPAKYEQAGRLINEGL